MVKSPPPPPPPAPRVPPPPPVPKPPSGSSISSSSYYSRPSNQYAVPVQPQQQEAQVVPEPPQQTTQSFNEADTVNELPNIADGFMIGPPKEDQQSITPLVESSPAQTILPAKQQQVQPIATTITQSTIITSSLELSGIPSTIPPQGSMERMALLNLLVHRIESKLTSSLLTTSTVKEITILSIGDVDMTTRRLRHSHRGNKRNGQDRALWSSTQVVKFEALLEYSCGEEDEDSCMENAQASAEEIVNELEPSSPNTGSTVTSSNVDNEGEDWDNINGPSSSFVWLPNPSENVAIEVITSKPTNLPTSNPTPSPTPIPTNVPTPSPSVSNIISQSMQSYSVSIEIESPKPTTQPTSMKPTSPSAIVGNKWFSDAGLFQGDASKRYCGYDWVDVVNNCL